MPRANKESSSDPAGESNTRTLKRGLKMVSFSSLLGNEALKTHLQKALSDQHISHAYLLEGPEGSGKKTAAAAFVRALFCLHPVTGPDGRYDSCGQCENCRLLDHDAFPDLALIEPEDGAKSLSAQIIRQRLVSDATVLPYKGSRKVYVVDRADLMTPEAQNALLKTIEEPPQGVTILLLCQSASLLLPTVLSRCVRLSTAPLPPSVIENVLVKRGADPSRAASLAALSQGSLGKALALFEDDNFSALRENWFHFLSSIPTMPQIEVLQKGGELFDTYASFQDQLLSLSLIWFSDLLKWKTAGDRALLVSKDYCPQIQKASSFYTDSSLIAITETIRRIGACLARNANKGLAQDLLLISFTGKDQIYW